MRAHVSEDRVARARAVLHAAEQRTGARALAVVSADRPQVALPVEVDRSMAAAWPVEAAQPTQAESTSLRGVDTLVSTERPPLPVSPELRPLLPDGLRRGITVQVAGATTVVLALLAQASREGSWAALVGAPSVGLLAAVDAGIELKRLVLVPAPGPHSATAIAALLDGMDLVVVGPEAALLDSDRRRLVARARERAAVIIAMRPWAGAHMTLRTESSTWSGLGVGRGRLRNRELVLSRTDRSRGGPPLRHTVQLPFEAPIPLADHKAIDTSNWIDLAMPVGMIPGGPIAPTVLLPTFAQVG